MESTMTKKSRSTVKNDSAGTFADWRARVATALERTHGISAGTIPAPVWKHAYVQGLTPEDAAEQAAVSAYNVRPASDRLKGRRS
jgi:hypothetical protein